MLTVLPDWFVKLVPPGYLHGRAREFYNYTLNQIPFSTAFGSSQAIEVVFSKKNDSLIFGGQCLVTAIPALGAPPTINGPQANSTTQLLAKLGNPAGDEVYTSDFVPLESLFSAWGGVGTAQAVNQVPASQPAIWPVPIPVKRGGSLLLTLTSARNPTFSSWVRLTFWGALLFDRKVRRKAA